MSGSPSTVIGNVAQDIVQTLALVNAAGDELAREHQWQALTKQHRFTATFYTYTGNTTAGSTSVTGMSSVANLDNTFMAVGGSIPQDTMVVSASGTTVVLTQAPTATASTVSITFSKVLFAPPDDFDRQIDRTHWDRSKHWEMLGPQTAQQNEWLRSGYISTGPRIRYRYFGGYFQIWPALGSTENLVLEYVSKYWVQATGSGVVTPTKQAFAVDTDTCIFPDALMRLLIKLKYYEVKNFDTTAYYRDYMTQKDLAKAHDAGSQTLSMSPTQSTNLIGYENIPDSGYG